MDKQNTKVSSNRIKKEAIVAEVKEKVDKAKAMVFTNYQGLTHQQLEGFKREIRKADAEFVAAKNTLLKIALGKENVTGNEDHFNQPTGTIFMYGDIVEPLKVLAKMMKDLEKPSVKFGFLEGKVITEADVKKLATLPSREVLIAQMLGMMNAPIQGLHRALSWNLQKFVMTLSAVAKKKEETKGTEGTKETKEEPKIEAAAPAASKPTIAGVEEPKEEKPVTNEAETTAEPGETPEEEPKAEEKAA